MPKANIKQVLVEVYFELYQRVVPTHASRDGI
jgi:hypothetical protein